MSQTLPRWLFRAIPAPVVLAFAAASFTHIGTTAGTADKPAAALYHALQLFALNGSATPTNGPTGWLLVAWLAYFVAPVLTAAAAVDVVLAASETLLSAERRARSYRDHVVIAGLGNHGRLIARQVRLVRPEARLVYIDRDVTLRHSAELPRDDRPIPVPLVVGDMSASTVLRAAGVERCSLVVFAAGHDMANLRAALVARAYGVPVLAVVSDIDLSTSLRQLAQRTGVEVVNPYELAAEELVRAMEEDGTLCHAAEGQIVIAGFGRFGQMLLRTLDARRSVASCGAGAPLNVVVVDREVETRLRQFRRRHATATVNVTSISEDVAYLVPAQLDGDREKRIVIICTDDDIGNLTLALALDESNVSSLILTRFFDPIELPAALRHGDSIRHFEIARLLENALRTRCASMLARSA